MAVIGGGGHLLKIILVIYVLKNTGKMAVNTGKIQGKHREFNLNLNVATLHTYFNVMIHASLLVIVYTCR